MSGCMQVGINGDCGLGCRVLDDLDCPEPSWLLEVSEEEKADDPERYQDLLESYDLIKPVKSLIFMIESD